MLYIIKNHENNFIASFLVKIFKTKIEDTEKVCFFGKIGFFRIRPWKGLRSGSYIKGKR